MEEVSKYRWAHEWRSITLAALFTVWAWAAPANAARSDAWITTKVKLALLTAEGVSASKVNVDTVNGEVTLHGKVNSPQEKEKAESVARSVEGVRDIRDLLQVVPEEHEKIVQRSDDQIKKQVDDALKNDPSLKDSSITVKSVNNGVVLLAGHAKTLVDQLSAVETAASVPGVRRVASEIQSPDQLGDAEIWHEAEHAASAAAHGVSNTARDMYITSATKLRLLADRNTPALDIHVDTRNGVVTLFGIVPSEQAKSAAAADAGAVSGVKQVKNELQVVPKAEQKTVKTSDEQIKRAVKQAFDNHEDLRDIHVDVKNCIARLTGSVPSGMQRLEAVVVARSTQGVCSVQDDLHVAD